MCSVLSSFLRYADISFIFLSFSFLNSSQPFKCAKLRTPVWHTEILIKPNKKNEKKAWRMNSVGRWTERTMVLQFDTMEPWKFISFEIILCLKFVDGSIDRRMFRALEIVRFDLCFCNQRDNRKQSSQRKEDQDCCLNWIKMYTLKLSENS